MCSPEKKKEEEIQTTKKQLNLVVEDYFNTLDFSLDSSNYQEFGRIFSKTFSVQVYDDDRFQEFISSKSVPLPEDNGMSDDEN